MPPILIAVIAGASVMMVVVGIMMSLMKPTNSEAEQRLDDLSKKARRGGGESTDPGSLLKDPKVDDATRKSWLFRVIPNHDSLAKLYEAADVKVPLKTLVIFSLVLLVVGPVVVIAFKLPVAAAPVSGLVLACLPYLWLRGQKASRVKKFLEKFPEAMELMGRALRAGHGLASGMHLVSEEMEGPIADEFGKVFEEQNFGVPLEESLRGMADRVPTMDVRFFVTAVIIQRSTGGDLAEILDKIGRLIRQRFELQGHVKALTAEGRLSGMVLMALPPGLVGFLLVANPKYIGTMFSTEIGQKMLAATVVMQILGALAIKKIVAIKV